MTEEIIIQIVVARALGNTAVKTYFRKDGQWNSDVEVEHHNGDTQLIRSEEIGSHGSNVVYDAITSLVDAFKLCVPESEMPNIVPVEANPTGEDSPLN